MEGLCHGEQYRVAYKMFDTAGILEMEAQLYRGSAIEREWGSSQAAGLKPLSDTPRTGSSSLLISVSHVL